MNCDYCGTYHSKRQCPSCGAPSKYEAKGVSINMSDIPKDMSMDNWMHYYLTTGIAFSNPTRISRLIPSII